MKKIIVFIFISASVLACIKAQIIPIDYFRTKTVRDLIIYCGYNEDSALCFLSHQIYKDSILGSTVWYSESCAKGIPVEVKSHYGADKYAVSLKMKVFYYVLQIFYEDYYSDLNTVCIFMDKKKKPVMDMCLVYNGPWNSIDDIVTNPPVYHKYACPESKSIELLFEEWMNKYNQYGLDYLRNQNISPIPLEMWNLGTCQSNINSN